jgi:class 3 adenylate cyclase
LESRKPLRLGSEWIVGITLLLALIGVAIGLLKKGISFNVIAGVVLIGGLWVGGLLGFTHGVPLVPLVSPTIALALSLWMMDVLVGSAERKQREFVQGAFSRYVSPAVVGQLVDNPEALKIQGDRKELTFVFTDVAGFTTMSEKLTSEKLSEVLNAYLDGACEIILRYEGTIDKFIGDAIMSIFNAPIPQPDHYSRAVKCALELDEYAEKFRIAQNDAGVPMGVTRIGLHAGQAVIGNFGSRSRMDFTALGDTVNTAARCEGVNKYFGTRICCTETVVAHVTDVKFMPVGDVVLKGKLTPVGLFNPISQAKSQSEIYRRYMETYALLKAESPDAAESVRALYKDFPDEPLVAFHHERVEAGLATSLVVMDDK